MIGFSRKFLLIVPVVLIVGFCFRPTLILGVDGQSLAASVGVPVGEVGFEPCAKSAENEGENESWVCTLPNDPNSTDAGTTKYAVSIDNWGCWKLEGTYGSGSGSGSSQAAEPEKTEDCVTIISHIEATD